MGIAMPVGAHRQRFRRRPPVQSAYLDPLQTPPRRGGWKERMKGSRPARMPYRVSLMHVFPFSHLSAHRREDKTRFKESIDEKMSCDAGREAAARHDVYHGQRGAK